MQKRKITTTISMFLLWSVCITTIASGQSGTIWFVDQSSPLGGDGTSWTNAFQSLDNAIDAALTNDDIWIATGTYIPTRTDGVDDRTATFELSYGIGLYGGFAGTESTLSERILFANPTIISGDLFGDDNTGGSNGENAYHVFTVTGVTTNALTFDSIQISAGNALSATDSTGGGIFIDDTTTKPIYINRCNIHRNTARIGGGIACNSAIVTLNITSTNIQHNMATLKGGGIFSAGSAVINTCLIAANRAHEEKGGAMLLLGDLEMRSTTVAQNEAQLIGGIAVGGATATIVNSILWDNDTEDGNEDQVQVPNGTLTITYSCVDDLSDSFMLYGNIDNNPRFIDNEGSGDENFRLKATSPCIDAAHNADVTVSPDLDGHLRFIDDPFTDNSGDNPPGDPVSDMGPYEYISSDAGFAGTRIWSGSNSNQFDDSFNWLPLEVPGLDDEALFDITSVTDIAFTPGTNVTLNSLTVASGVFSMNLSGTTIEVKDTNEAMSIGAFHDDAKLSIENGSLILDSSFEICGSHSTIQINSSALLQTTSLDISDGATLILSGTHAGNLVNSGGDLSPAGLDIATARITGNYDGPLIENKLYAGVMTFDIDGTLQGIDHDYVSIDGYADLIDLSVVLRYSPSWTPLESTSFDLISAAGGLTNLPRVLMSTGLPNELTTQWIGTASLRGGGETNVTTTGPILFGIANAVSITETPSDFLVADFDGINGVDIAYSATTTAGTGSVYVLLNNGMTAGVWQGFAAPIIIATGSTAEDIEVGDLDNDNTLDLVVANYNDNTVTILLNDGSASFTTTTLATGNGPISLAIGDFDTSDLLGLADIAVGCDSSTPVGVEMYTNATVMAARGPRVATFNYNSTWSTPIPTSIDPTDINDTKDLDRDLIILSNSGNSVTVKRGDGTGGTLDPLSMPIGLPTGSTPVAASFAALNGDTYEDYITINSAGNTISLLHGNGSSLNIPSTIPVGTQPQSIAVADFDNDGDDDFVLSAIGSTSLTRELTVIRNDTTVSTTTVLSDIGAPVASGSEPTLIATGDFDADGLTDIVSVIDLAPAMRANSPAISVYLNETALACPADFDGSGIVDVDDLLSLIAGFGSANPTLDLNGNGIVDVDDLLILIGAWGPC